MKLSKQFSILYFLAAPVLLAGQVLAVAPTQEAIAKWKQEGTYAQKIADWQEFKALGGCSPSEHSAFDKKRITDKMAAGVAAVDTARILVILVDFSDHVYNGNTYSQAVAATPQKFDSILFTNKNIGPVINPTGSLTDYYLENSYGNFYVRGGITNWKRMPNTYTYYEGGTSGIGTSTFKSQQMVLSAIDAVNDSINFQDFDYNQDGAIDGLVIIHAGHGAEAGVFGIWSHKFHLANPVVRDGVTLYDYTMNPEEGFGGISPIGVICHEFGHFLGVPDLYDITDTTGTSHGLGNWSLMATGNYNGNAKKPAHFDAWCKDQIGFLTLTNVSANLNNVQFRPVEFTPTAYRLSNGVSSPEYWIVENRQRIGFDLNLPWPGMLIYHVDPAAPTVNGSNSDPDRYLVGLEQADGLSQLNYALNNDGDVGDPYPGSSGNRAFHDLSVPSDEVHYSPGLFPHIGVWEIYNSDTIMFADLDISWSRPYIVNDNVRFDDALGNNDGNLDPGETIRVYLIARNLMRTGYNAKANLATTNPDVNITTNNVQFAATFNNVPANNNSAPLVFTLADSTETKLDSFFLTISCDSTSGGAPGAGLNYSRRLGIEMTVGTPRVLIVDDDRLGTFDVLVKSVFSRNKIATKVWHVNSQGIPPINELQKYPHVFWHTADSTANAISPGKIAVMKAYMDAGGNIFLSTMSGIRDMHILDPVFLNNYFKATYTGQTDLYDIPGVAGSELGNSSRYRANYAPPFNHQRQIMSPVGGGEAFLNHFDVDGNPLYCGISYSGSYKSVLVSFPFEAIQDNVGGSFRPKDTLVLRVLKFFGDFATGIGDGPFSNLPQSFQLNQNYPNPFNPSTTISYTIHSRGTSQNPYRTVLEIYNLLGQRVRTLVDEPQPPGIYEVQWAGVTDAGTKVASGIYFYRLVLGDQSQTKKMVFIK